MYQIKTISTIEREEITMNPVMSKTFVIERLAHTCYDTLKDDENFKLFEARCINDEITSILDFDRFYGDNIFSNLSEDDARIAARNYFMNIELSEQGKTVRDFMSTMHTDREFPNINMPLVFSYDAHTDYSEM